MRIETMIRYVRAMVDYRGESRACRMLRSRLGWFVKGLPHAGAFREAIKSITAEDEALAAIETFCATLEKNRYRNLKQIRLTARTSPLPKIQA
jgi:tRNA-dihydrouridine synthase